MSEENLNNATAPRSVEQQQACSPASFIAEVLRKDDAAVDELKALLPEYTPPTEYAALHAQGREALETLDEMTSLLRSAICICERQGAETNWEGFAASIRKLGLTGVTARTYRQANVAGEATASKCSSPVGSRSGLPFETLRKMAKSKRMELGRLSHDPFYYHTHDCQGCEQECNGLDGRHIADDAKDIAGWTNDKLCQQGAETTKKS